MIDQAETRGNAAGVVDGAEAATGRLLRPSTNSNKCFRALGVVAAICGCGCRCPGRSVDPRPAALHVKYIGWDTRANTLHKVIDLDSVMARLFCRERGLYPKI